MLDLQVFKLIFDVGSLSNVRSKYGEFNSIVVPWNTTGLNIGESTNRYQCIYLKSSPNVTSDRNEKNSIVPISDKYIAFFQLLQPVSFMFNSGTSGRTHIGFISQDVEEAMEQTGLTDLDFAGFCKDRQIMETRDENGKIHKEPVFDENGDPAYIYSLRYEEFIALNTAVIQQQQKKLEELEARLLTLESKSN